jgi:hypothetical protein
MRTLPAWQYVRDMNVLVMKMECTTLCINLADGMGSHLYSLQIYGCVSIQRFSEIVLDGQRPFSSSVGMYRGGCIPHGADVGRESHAQHF